MTITIGNTNGHADYTIAERTVSTVKYPQGLVSFLDSAGAYVADLSGRDLGSDVGAAYVDARPLPVAFPSTPGTLSAITGMTAATYADGEGIGTTTTITGMARANGGSGIITRVLLVDRDDEGPAVDMHLWVSAPTWNNDAAAGPSDANADLWLGMVPFPSTGWTDLGGVRVQDATVQLPYVCGAASTSIVVTFMARGAYGPAATTDLRFGVFGYLD